MIVQNTVPLLAVIIESIAGLFMIGLAISGIRRYLQKRSSIAFALTGVLILFGLATTISGIGKYLDFISPYDRITERSYMDLTIAISYSFLIASNIFFSYLLSALYLDKDNQLPLFLVIFNSILIGMVIPQIKPTYGVYEQLLPVLILFVLVTFLIHGIFIKNSLKEAGQSDEAVTKARFRMIALFSTLIITVLVLFLIDLVIGFFYQGWTVFYYAAWITVALSAVVGYLGYFMPDWFQAKLRN